MSEPAAGNRSGAQRSLRRISLVHPRKGAVVIPLQGPVAECGLVVDIACPTDILSLQLTLNEDPVPMAPSSLSYQPLRLTTRDPLRPSAPLEASRSPSRTHCHRRYSGRQNRTVGSRCPLIVGICYGTPGSTCRSRSSHRGYVFIQSFHSLHGRDITNEKYAARRCGRDTADNGGVLKQRM